MKKMNPAFLRDERRDNANRADRARFAKYLGSRTFDWESRYDKKYLLQFSRDYEFNSSRLQRAVDHFDYKERLVKNRIQREKEDAA